MASGSVSHPLLVRIVIVGTERLGSSDALDEFGGLDLEGICYF